MKQPETFKTDQPLIPGFIYLIQQGVVKRVCSAGSVIRMNLSGHWKIIKAFENEVSRYKIES
jgi:hypothetical protein